MSSIDWDEKTQVQWSMKLKMGRVLYLWRGIVQRKTDSIATGKLCLQKQNKQTNKKCMCVVKVIMRTPKATGYLTKCQNRQENFLQFGKFKRLRDTQSSRLIPLPVKTSPYCKKTTHTHFRHYMMQGGITLNKIWKAPP